MLELEYVNDRARLLAVYAATGRNNEPSGVNVVLTENGGDIGFARLLLGEQIVLDDFVLAPYFDEFGNRDFFFRALLYKLLPTGKNIRVKTADERLKKFGFLPQGEWLEVVSGDIDFPSSCGCNH